MILNLQMAGLLLDCYWENDTIQDQKDLKIVEVGKDDEHAAYIFACNNTQIKNGGAPNVDKLNMEELTAYEWNTNELWFDGKGNSREMFSEMMSTIHSLILELSKIKRQCEFEIVASIDNGSREIAASYTIRFYVIRNGSHYINNQVESLNEFHQPVLVYNFST